MSALSAGVSKVFGRKSREEQTNLSQDRKPCQEACISAQLALAWVLHQGDDVVPIPGELFYFFEGVKCFFSNEITQLILEKKIRVKCVGFKVADLP